MRSMHIKLPKTYVPKAGARSRTNRDKKEKKKDICDNQGKTESTARYPTIHFMTYNFVYSTRNMTSL